VEWVFISKGSAYVDFTDYLDRVDEYNRQESHLLLRAAGQYLKDHKINWKALSLRGDAAELIIEKVSEYKADVLMMGSRGIGMLKRAFIGSVSDYCLHHSNCPVLIVKHPHPEELEQYHSALRQ
jgi:nucleotide-binding universal stress UspA family protein